MTRVELFNLLRPIIEKVTGLTGAVILADQNAPAPNGEYCTIEPMQRINERGQSNVYKTNAAGQSVNFKVKAQIIADVSVNFYRGEARSNAQKLKQCNKRPDVSLDLLRAKIGWFGTDAVNNLTTLVSGNQEQRAQITLRLGYETTDQEVINSIESASYEIQYEDGSVVATGDIL